LRRLDISQFGVDIHQNVGRPHIDIHHCIVVVVVVVTVVTVDHEIPQAQRHGRFVGLDEARHERRVSHERGGWNGPDDSAVVVVVV